MQFEHLLPGIWTPSPRHYVHSKDTPPMASGDLHRTKERRTASDAKTDRSRRNGLDRSGPTFLSAADITGALDSPLL